MKIREILPYQQLEHFYSSSFRSIASATIFPESQTFPSLGRTQLDTIKHNRLLHYSQRQVAYTSIIETFEYAGIQMSEQQRQNIALFSQNEALCVITGQQPYLFGGPNYIPLKAAGIIQWAASLSSDNNPVVPIFWIEDNDHDIAEISETYVSQGLETKHILYEQYQFLDGSIKENKKSTSEFLYTTSINDLKNELKDNYSISLHFDLLSHIIRGYQEGVSPSAAFCIALNEIFASEGLLFVCSSILRKNGAFIPILREELRNPGRSEKAVLDETLLLEKLGFTAQIKPSEFNLFISRGLGREKIIDVSKRRELLGTRDDFSNEEYLSMTPSVTLRPICQDFIFPNLLYVGGPGESSYYLQLRQVFHSFGVIQAPFVARPSATFIEEKSLRDLENLGLRTQDHFREYHEIESFIVHTSTDKKVLEQFLEFQSVIREHTQLLSPQISALDKTLIATLGRSEHEMLASLDNLQKKVLKAQKGKIDATLQKIRKVFSFVQPKQKLQERVFWFGEYIAKYDIETYRMIIMEVAKINVEANSNCHILVEL